MAFGDNKYVALGEGVVFISEDGVSWNKYTTGLSQINKVAWVKNQFIAVGPNGLIGTSKDGIHWTVRKSGTNNYLWDVA